MLLDRLLWYPKAFLESESGKKWDKVPSQGYYSTSWMDFFSGIHNGTFGKLSEELSGEGYTRYHKIEIESRLVPLMEQLRATTIEKGVNVIMVHIDIKKFRIYEDKLRKMSADDVIFDIIRDDHDIRERYEIHENFSQINSYLLTTLQWVLDSFVSAELKKIKELENGLRGLENKLQQKDTLLTLATERQKNLESKKEQSQKDLVAAQRRIEHLEESLSKYMEDEVAEEAESNDIKENSKLRMYYLYKLGFLDDSIWNDNIPQKVRGQIIGTILDAGPLKGDTAVRYYKFFNSTGSAELKEYDSKNEQIFFDYIRRNCPDIEFKKGQLINRLRKS